MTIKNQIKNAIAGTALEPFARKVLTKLRGLNWPDRTETINGKKFLIPQIRGLNSGFSEQWMLPILKTALKLRSESFLDIGVNTGQTLLKVKSIEPNRFYVGFEPNPSCVFYTEEMIKINKIKDVMIFPVGIYTENTILYLNRFTDTPTDSSASLISGFRPDSEIVSRIPVPVFDFTTLRDFISENSFGIIKIDIEGAELEVLKSLKKTIELDRPIILIEILPPYDLKNETRISRQLEIQSLIKNLGYEIFRVDISENGLFQNIDKVEKFEIHSDLNKCEFVFSPKEYADKLIF